jgi:long-chain acyl-CoA synthetase
VGSQSLRPPELTVPQMFRRTLERSAGKHALMYKKEGKFHPITYEELAVWVRNFALGLVSMGIGHGSKVALLSENRPEWCVVDLAALSIGAVNVPLYATLPPAQVEYIVGNADAEILIVSTQKQLDKALEVRGRLPQLKAIAFMDALPGELPDGVRAMWEIAERGAERTDAGTEFRRLSDAVKPSDLASIIYTSGTTGDPKGAMLTHDNFMSNAQAVIQLVDIILDDIFLSFLPLSHVFERIAGHYLSLAAGATTAYAESVFTVATNMVEVKPTVMASTPRLYEALEARIKNQIAKQPDSKRKAAEWALKVGWDYHSRRIQGDQPGMAVSAQYAIADRTVLSAIREKATGGRLRFFISGGAPLPVETAKFITSLGLHVLEGYGLTETSPVICVNRPKKTKLGTVGPVISGVEVKIAEDGEILSRGPHIMRGYYKLPEETAKAIDPDGWFHTGDIGVLDEEGFLRITDRKKDIIVLANGKNVAPQPIEAKLKASPHIANAVLFGDRQAQVVALVVPDFERLREWAAEQGLKAGEPEELIRLAEVKTHIKAEVDRLTTDLADFEKIRRITLLPRDFSMERDELTPTLKVKRRVVAEHYAAEIQAMYGGARSED